MLLTRQKNKKSHTRKHLISIVTCHSTDKEKKNIIISIIIYFSNCLTCLLFPNSQLDRFLPISKLKYYFAVDTVYVGKKLGLLVFPYMHEVWLMRSSCAPETCPDRWSDWNFQQDSHPASYHGGMLLFAAYLPFSLCLCKPSKFEYRSEYFVQRHGVKKQTGITYLVKEMFLFTLDLSRCLCNTSIS